MPPFLDIKNATAYRGRHKVFENLTLKLEDQVHAAILGPNGAGKSTLLRLLNQELRPVVEEGSHVRIWGKARWSVRELRAKMGLVSHDLQVRYHGFVTGRDVVKSGYHASIGLYPHQAFDAGQLQRVETVMDQVGIMHLAERPFQQMSTGEQRRFLLARALVNDPQMLVLDEPTAGMDPGACFLYLDIIRQLMREGKTVILVTHHIHEIPPEIAQVVLLKEGQVVAQGSKQDVLTGALMSDVFGRPLQVLAAGSYFQVVPAS